MGQFSVCHRLTERKGVREGGPLRALQKGHDMLTPWLAHWICLRLQSGRIRQLCCFKALECVGTCYSNSHPHRLLSGDPGEVDRGPRAGDLGEASIPSGTFTLPWSCFLRRGTPAPASPCIPGSLCSWHKPTATTWLSSPPCGPIG